MNAQSTAQDTWDALTCEVDEFGDRTWRDENGELHRENGPALITSLGTQCWYRHGVRHREDGPAVVYFDGSILFCINGEQLSEEEFNARKLTVNRSCVKMNSQS